MKAMFSCQLPLTSTQYVHAACDNNDTILPCYKCFKKTDLGKFFSLLPRNNSLFGQISLNDR